MMLSVIIPVYNEEQTIKSVLTKLNSIKLPCPVQLIVVNDGSTDNTVSEIKASGLKKNRIKLISHPVNKGKGAAIISGIKEASGDYLLIHDADLEYNPDDIFKLLSPVLENKNIKAVYGSRFIKRNNSMPLLYLLGNKFLTLLTNIVYGTKLTDMETGYKLLPTAFMKKMKLRKQRFDIEPEITIGLVKNRIPVVEIPISYQSRSHLAGKKLTVKDAFGAVLAILDYRFK